MSTAAVARFEFLRRKFRAMIPPSRNTSRKRRSELTHAASIEQVREMAALERACGAGHDRALIDRLNLEVQKHLAAAGVKTK